MRNAVWHQGPGPVAAVVAADEELKIISSIATTVIVVDVVATHHRCESSRWLLDALDVAQ